MRLLDVASAIAPRLNAEGRLIRLPQDRTVVFVGDTHGDLEATERVFSRHLRPDRTIVFLGDAVDRGPDSTGNLELILKTKLDRPAAVHLLMGNHEAWAVASFSPADFWQALDANASQILSEALSKLPFAAWHPDGVLGLHGALPDGVTLDGFDSIELGSKPWRAITWGDWSASAEKAGRSPSSGRPTFGPREFASRSAALTAKVLVRSHQPSAPTYLFEDRCLTLFTSSAYGAGPRSIALLRPDRPIRTARDLEVETID